jgi:hypothetical protein
METGGMSEAKPIASLSPKLLARKGGARPAMRQHTQTATAHQLDDLGFDDFGEDEGYPAHQAEIVQLNPGSKGQAGLPEVLQQRAGAAARVAMSAKPRRSALADGRNAAFTLRLDAERHLKLRLACAIEGRSAQQLVTDALDQLISSIPDVATMAAQVRNRGQKS